MSDNTHNTGLGTKTPSEETKKTKVPLSEMIWYGAGDLFGGGSATLVSVLLLNFFNVGLGITAGVASTVVMVSKLWDGISDPLMGVITDNTRSRFGRRRPYIFLGGILTFFALSFLFAPIRDIQPEWVKVGIATIAFLFYCTVSTVSQVPYTSLASDISPDHRQRNNANTIKLVFDMIAAGLCYLIPTLVYEAFKNGSLTLTQFWLVMTFGFGTLFAFTLIMCAVKVKERTPFEDKKVKFSFRNFVAPLKISSYRNHIFMYIAAFLCMDIVSALAIYYADYIMKQNHVMIFGMQGSSLFLIAPMMVMAAVIIPVYYILMRKTTKQFTYRLGIPLYVLGAVLLASYQPNVWPSWLVPIFAMIIGAGLGSVQMMPWLVFPDAVDVGELRTGERQTGSFSGLMTFSRKCATALAIAIVGWVIQLSGQVLPTEDVSNPAQPDTVILAIRLILSISVVLLMLLGFISSIKYKVDNEKLTRIRYFLDKMHRDEELTEEEKQEKTDIIRLLADKRYEPPAPKAVPAYLTLPADRPLKILQLTDIHIGAGILSKGEDKQAIAAVKRVVNAAKPDLIVVTGDAVYPIPFFSGTRNNISSFKVFTGLMESFGRPWAFCFGNHDSEPYAIADKNTLADMLEECPHCIFNRGPEDVDGVGNYTVDVKNAEGKTVWQLFLMDSNMYQKSHWLSFFSGFDNIHENQVEWYRKKVQAAKNELGTQIPGLLFIHIPLNEYKDAWAEIKAGSTDATLHAGIQGERPRKDKNGLPYDYFGVPKVRSKMFEAILEEGTTKGVFCGHDHTNTLSMEYKGVRLTYGLSIDYLAYRRYGIKKQDFQRGGTVISIGHDGKFSIEELKLKDIE